MKRNVRNLTILILFLVFALSLCVFSACSDTNDADPSVKPQGATVTVSLDFSDERGVVRVSGKVGELTMEYALPEREGYAFGGWYLNDELYDFVVYPNRDISLTARWLEGVTVRFNTGSSDVVLDDIVVVQGETIPEPIVEREGYLLRRWTYLNIEFDFDTPITTDITLTAEWLERTNLPTMSVELLSSMGNTISLSSVTRETYVDSEITLTNADGDYVLFSTACEFKGRGNGSWEAEKKGYKLKFAKKQGLFGRAANKHWVVLACANFDDQTMCRNLTAYEMAGQILGGIEYVTNAVWIDFYVNGEYRGVYVLCEHVRVGDGRVVLTSQYGVEDTGYLIEYDAYAEGVQGVDYFSINPTGGSSSGTRPGGRPSGSGSSNNIVKYNFTMHSPSPEDYATEGGITETQYRAQVSFIQDYVKRVYTAAITDRNFATFSELADVDSFVDVYIMNEFYKNTDAGYSSFYLYKKPGGKLYAGPPWDFDGTTNAARGSSSATGIYVADSIRTGSNYTSSEILINLYATSEFKAKVVARWKQISSKMAAYYDGFFTEKFYSDYRYAMGKNFVKYGNRLTQANAETNWINNTRTLYTWFKNRITYLNGAWV